MCAAAIAVARVKALRFGAEDPKGGGVVHGAPHLRPADLSSSPRRPRRASARTKPPSCSAVFSPSGVSPGTARGGSRSGGWRPSASRRLPDCRAGALSPSPLEAIRALGNAMSGKIGRDRRRPFVRQRLVGLRRSSRVGMGKDVDEGPVAGLHRARDLQQRRIGGRLHGRAAGIEGESGRNADDDAPPTCRTSRPMPAVCRRSSESRFGHVGAGFSRR